ncbi:MAG: hypothetical protein E6I87_03130 [Chloroflexi bacterium]|nr:MAG: hypothetical protein E6I87_03130 [Chloroflexota bacterium]
MAKKLAISMPEAIFKEMERSRKRRGKDRSAWLQEAIGERLRREKREADIAAYVRSYEEEPVTPEERTIVRAGLNLIPQDHDEWPEAPR